MKEKVAEYILGGNGNVVWIVGTTSMTLLLVSTLELDVVNIIRQFLLRFARM